MIRSMTGFGAAEARQDDGSSLRAEIRSVNHRHLNISANLPKGWEALRARVLHQVRERLGRGSVTVSLTRRAPDGGDPDAPTLDIGRAMHYARQLRVAAAQIGALEREVDLATLVRLPGVLRVDGGERRFPIDKEALVSCLAQALEEVDWMRAQEGEQIDRVLRASLARIVDQVDAMEARAPERLIRERDRLRERVAALAESVDVDEERLAREVAYLADKWDIAEEVARLRAHAVAFVATLNADPEPWGADRSEDRQGAGEGGGPVDNADAGDEAWDLDEWEAGRRTVGKRLGFLVQEMHREANTVGAKANDVRIGGCAMAIKEELERLREQLENVQ